MLSLFKKPYQCLPDETLPIDPIDPTTEETKNAAVSAILKHAMYNSRIYDPKYNCMQTRSSAITARRKSIDKNDLKLVKSYIEHGQEVTTLKFVGNTKKAIDRSTIIYLKKYFSSLQTITFVFYAVSDGILSHLKDIPTLQNLHIYNHQWISNKGIKYISKIKDLTTLVLSNQKSYIRNKNKKVTNKGIKHINRLEKITEISLEGFAGITLICIESIMGCESLRSITFNNCNKITQDDDLYRTHLKSIEGHFTIMVNNKCFF